MTLAPDPIQQAAALPRSAGQICLVTSTGGKRWLIPKGWLEPGKTAGKIALLEAWEEAVLVGALRPELVGSYRYEKDGRAHHVLVFLLSVTEAADDWPERRLRQRCWLTPTQALVRIEDGGLRERVRLVVTVVTDRGSSACRCRRAGSPRR